MAPGLTFRVISKREISLNLKGARMYLTLARLPLYVSIAVRDRLSMSQRQISVAKNVIQLAEAIIHGHQEVP